MSELVTTAQIVLGNNFVMYFKAHSYHWNVRGSNFGEMHGFFGGIYEDLHDTVDTAAEEIRALDAFAPCCITEMVKYATITEDSEKPASTREMLTNLQEANNEVIESLNKLFEVATSEKKQGLADFAAGRLDVHAKHAWMIRSYLEG